MSHFVPMSDATFQAHLDDVTCTKQGDACREAAVRVHQSTWVSCPVCRLKVVQTRVRPVPMVRGRRAV